MPVWMPIAALLLIIAGACAWTPYCECGHRGA